MPGFQANILVQRKRVGGTEVQPVPLVPCCQFVVDGQRRGACGKPQHGFGFAPEQGLDGVCCQGADLPAAGEDDNFHVVPPFC